MRRAGRRAMGMAAVLAVVAASLPSCSWRGNRPLARPTNGTVAKTIPRMPDGTPDLSGVWSKPHRRNTALEAEPLPFTAAGRAAFENRVNVIDPTSTCRAPGTPRVTSWPYVMEILQRPDKVVMVYEYMHNFRVIPTDGRGHPKEVLPSLMGHSVGRWEGDTLVIDTIGFTDRTWLDDHGNQHSEALHLIERYQRISSDQIRYDFTIEDPKFYTKPWSNGWVFPLAPPDWEVMEYSCMDNNKALEEGHLRPGPH